MKKIFSIIAVTAGALMAASCSDFLDQSSESEHTDGDVWESTYYTSLRVNKLYGALGQDRTYSQDLAIVWNMNSDCELVDGLGNNATVTSSERGAMNFNMDPGWTKINDLWTAMYGIIEDANVNIKNIKESSLYASGDKTSKALMQRYLGESLTLRAMVYFDLVRIFGDIPFKTEPSKSDRSNVYLSKTDRDEIMDKLMADLEEAINYLPWADDASNFTTEHVTKGYAHGLLGQIALTKAGWAIRESAKTGYETASNADDKTISDETYPTQRPDETTRNALYQKAIEHFAVLINSGKHGLNPSFGQEWYLINQLILDQTYRENIFEMPMGENYTGELGYTVGVRLNGRTSEYGYSNSTGKMKLTAPLLYSYKPGDTRRDITISPMEIKDDDGRTIESMLGNAPFGLYVGKWDPRKMSASWLSNNLVAEAKHMTGINPVKMRFANVLLWFAEAMNELYGPTTPNAICGLSAYEALAKVHNRAFTVNNGTDEKPVLTEYPQDAKDFLSKARSSKEDMFEAIIQENAWEFAGEGFRKYDLIRWNLLYAKIKEFKQTYLNQLTDGTYQEKVYFNYKNEAKTKLDMSSVTWNGIPDGKVENDYAGSVNSFGSSKTDTGKDTQVDTNLPSISSGLTGEYGVELKVKNRYLMPIGSTTISASNGKLHNSYGYSD